MEHPVQIEHVSPTEEQLIINFPGEGGVAVNYTDKGVSKHI